MNTKILLAALGGAVASFLLGWLVYGMLLMEFYEANTVQYDGLMKEMPNLVLIFISGFISSFLYAFIFGRLANIRTFGAGFIYGMVIGFLITLGFDTYFLAAMNLFSGTLVVVDVIVGTVYSGVIGGVVAWILGMGRNNVVKDR